MPSSSSKRRRRSPRRSPKPRARRCLRRGFETLEDRRLLTATTADLFAVVPNSDDYDAGGLLQSKSLFESTPQFGRDVVDLSSNPPGDQAYRLTLTDRSSGTVDFDPLVQYSVLHEWIRVDPAAAYELTALGQHGQHFVSDKLHVSFAAFDAAQRRIEPIHVNKYPGAADTVLLQTLNPGDTDLLVSDATGWSNEVGLASATRAIAWYGAASGEVFEDYGYTRLTKGDLDGGLWSAGGVETDAASGGYRITLREPWPGDPVLAGTAIRNAVADDGTYELEVNRHGAAQFWERQTSFGRGFHAEQMDVHARFGGQVWMPEAEMQNRLPPGTEFVQIFSNHVLTTPTIRPAGDATAEGPAVASFNGDARTVSNRSLQAVESDTDFVVDPSRSYELSVVASVHGASQETHSIGYTAYDADGLLIEPQHVQRYASAVDTTLDAELRPGDTAIQLTDASGWSNDNSDPRTRSLAWYGYRDSRGTTYADYSYTRNVATEVNGVWSVGAIVGNSIQLDQPWDGPVLAAGTSVRNAVAGNAIVPIVLDNGAISTIPTRLYSPTPLSGTWTDGLADETRFPPGTVSIRPAALLNQSSLEDDDVVVLESFAVSEAGFFQVVPDGSHRYSLNLDVAANDPLVIGGASVQLVDVTQPKHGSVGIAADGTVDYVSPAWFVGLERFSYTLRDTVSGEEHTESVSVRIGGTSYGQDAALAAALSDNQAAPNSQRPPVANDDEDTRGFYDVLAGQTMTVDGFTQRDLLLNDTNIAQSLHSTGPLTVWLLDGPEHGSLSVNPDGTFEYTPDDGFPDADYFEHRGFGLDSFRYAAFDGLRIDTAVAKIRVYRTEADLARSRLNQLVLQLHNYHSQFKELPIGHNHVGRDENGVAYLSWRVHLLPLLGYQHLYDQFDIAQPYDSPTNLPLLDKMPDIFRSGTDSPHVTTTRMQGLRQAQPYDPTDYPLVVGWGLPDQGVKFRDFLDGLNSSILLLQTGADAAVPWTANEEAEFNAGDPLATVGTIDQSGIPVAMADGDTFVIPANVDPGRLHNASVTVGRSADRKLDRRRYDAAPLGRRGRPGRWYLQLLQAAFQQQPEGTGTWIPQFSFGIQGTSAELQRWKSWFRWKAADQLACIPTALHRPAGVVGGI